MMNPEISIQFFYHIIKNGSVILSNLPKELLPEVDTCLAESKLLSCKVRGDNTVYLFTVAENDTGLITNQYYIVGEKKYCLVQESNFDESGECDEVAKNLIKSFKWK